MARSHFIGAVLRSAAGQTISPSGITSKQNFGSATISVAGGDTTVINPGDNVQNALSAASPGDTVQLASGSWPDISISGINKAVTLEWLSGASGAWLGISGCSGITFVNPRLLNGGIGLLSITGDSYDLTVTGGEFGPHYADTGTWMTTVSPTSPNWFHPGTNGPILFDDCSWHDLTRVEGNHTEGIALWGARNVTLTFCTFTNIAVYPISIDRWPNDLGDGWNTANSSKTILVEDCTLGGPDTSIGIYTSDGVTCRRTTFSDGVSCADGTYANNVRFEQCSGAGLPGALSGMSNVTWID